MKLALCHNGQEFLDRYKPILLAHEVVYQLIISNALRTAETPCAPDCFFGTVTDDDDRPLLLFGHTAPWRLLVHSLDSTATDEATALLAAFVVEKQIEIAGILASEAICAAFLACDTTHTYRRGLCMDIMELRQVNEIALAPGRLRQAATEEDLKLITQWNVAFNEEATGHTLDYDEALEKNRQRLSIFYLYENPDGQICAMAGINRELTLGCAAALVYTAPEERGKGYCSSLMYELSKLQLAKGREYVGLFVDQTNPISNHTYKKVGYRILEDSIEYDRITEAC